MGVRRYTTRLLGLVCLFGDLGVREEGEGEYLHLGVRKGEFGRGCGPKNWRGCLFRVWVMMGVLVEGGWIWVRGVGF